MRGWERGGSPGGELAWGRDVGQRQPAVTPEPRFSRPRRSFLWALLAAPVAIAVVVKYATTRRTLADGIDVPRDPKIVRSCQDFIEMMALRGTETRERSPNSAFVDAAAWQRLAPIERTALANAIAGRAFGKHVRYLADTEVGYVYRFGSDKLLATATNRGVRLA